MDIINDLRSIMTVVSFATFVAIVWWAYGRGRKSSFDEAANLPFAEDGDRPVERAPRGSEEQGKSL